VNVFKVYDQESQVASPWSLSMRLKILLWEYSWMVLCSWTPKPFNRWRLLWLKIFGATIYGIPFVHQRARIQYPWNLVLHNQATLGDRSNAYCLDIIELQEGATVAQEAYLCTGTHDFASPSRNLMTSSIVVGKNAFVGARTFIMPGVIVGNSAIIGACSVVTKDVCPSVKVKGNPAR
jgi:putative colanic acid biosynthesis acetyltransferase WcaF